MRPRISLEPLVRMRADIATPVRVAEDAAERAEDPLDRPRREPFEMQVAGQLGDVVRGDQRKLPATEPRQQMAAKVRAVEVERASPSLAAGDFRLELGQPASRDRRDR
jgi:hypothetical protein